MSTRAQALGRRYNAEVVRLLTLLTLARPDELARACPGREKLGDGTVATVAGHTVDNFGRLAAFATGVETAPAGAALTDRLRAIAPAVAEIAQLDDARLDSVPAEGSFRFCDGRRTLEQVLTGALTHQTHNIDAVASGLGTAP